MATRPPVTPVQLIHGHPDPGDDPHVVFYTAVKRAANGLGFQHYADFVATLFCPAEQDGVLLPGAERARQQFRNQHAALADCFRFNGTRAYDQLIEATQLFIGSQSALLDDCCLPTTTEPPSDMLAPAMNSAGPGRKASAARVDTGLLQPTCYDVGLIEQRFAGDTITMEQLLALKRRLFDPPSRIGMGPCCTDGDAPAGATATGLATASQSPDEVVTFMQQLVDNQAGVSVQDCRLGTGNCFSLLACKVRCPPMLELIWSYWMEQGMLVQGINAVTLRFQNRMYPGRDGLRRFDISPLRPLNNLLWGYVQREPDRLSLARRAYEYDHHYGLRLSGQAVPSMQPADSRTQFLEAFHRLLVEAMQYYHLSMNTTMQADAFPALDALRELHLTLAEGAHNQFGDLPGTARAEMLVQQWMLSRPEVREFLGGRPGVPYPEAWMPHVETLRQVMGWNDGSIRHYRDLATFGEQLLLSIRLLPWSSQTDANVAAGWLTFWRPEVQGYVHAYRAVTGVDLAMKDRPAIPGGQWNLQPSDLIQRRRMSQPQPALR